MCFEAVPVVHVSTREIAHLGGSDLKGTDGAIHSHALLDKALGWFFLEVAPGEIFLITYELSCEGLHLGGYAAGLFSWLG